MTLMNVSNLIKRWIGKFGRTGSPQKTRHQGRPITSRTVENVQRVDLVRANSRMLDNKSVKG